MSKYSLSVAAECDLDSILEYSLLNFGEEVAYEYFISLKHCISLIADSPELGQNISHIGKGYYKHIHASHMIFYKKERSAVFIIRILHKAMDVETNL